MFNKTIVVCAGILGLAVVASALLLSNLKIDFNNKRDIITVTGTAEKHISADRAEFSFTISVNSKDIASGYTKLEAECAKARNLMYNIGFKATELSGAPITLTPYYVRNSNGMETAEIRFFVLNRTISVSTANPQLADYGCQLPQQLMAEGTEVSVSGIYYSCKEPQRYYDELLARAGADAKKKADSIAVSGGFYTGKLLKAEPSGGIMIEQSGSSDLVASLTIFADYEVK